MKRLILLLVVLAAIFSVPVIASDDADVEAVKVVIVESYIEGIHRNQDPEAILKGFHPEFAMVMVNDGEVSKMTIQEWVARIEENNKKGKRPTAETTYEFATVEVSGTAAIARIELFKDGKLTYTDFMSLYKFDDGWKIVNKIY
ncbi:unnamed protein product, partial [marine sediment metagenome]